MTVCLDIATHAGKKIACVASAGLDENSDSRNARFGARFQYDEKPDVF